MAYNKVVYDGSTLIDLTGDTAVEGRVVEGDTFHKADGTLATGTLLVYAEGYYLMDESNNYIIDENDNKIIVKLVNEL